MRVEILASTANGVRFPVERRVRPTLDLLREIAPDVREVLLIADGFGLESPAFDVRERVDAETAAYIVDQSGGPGVPAIGVLAALPDLVVATAIEAEEARRTRVGDRRCRIDPTKERAEALTFRAAELLIAAHIRVEEAEGVARAVGLARRGEVRAPRDLRPDEEVVSGPAVRHAGW